MVNHTRLDCVLGGAAGMRAGVAQAIHHASQRAAFGKVLIEQPLMQNVLADLAIESEAATIAAMRLARAYDEAVAGDEEARLQARLRTRCSSTGSASAAPAHAAEALECLGGNGYVEESGMPRLYREAPLNSIWEGSGNVQCLDVLRGDGEEPGLARGVLRRGRRGGRLRAAARRTRSRTCKAESRRHRRRSSPAPGASSSAWRSCCRASLLVRFGDEAVADAFCASRLAGDWGHAFGTLPAGTDFDRIITRHAAA